LNICGIPKGAVGGPKWGTGTIRPEQGILRLRKELDVYANIRPALFPAPSLVSKSPIKEEYARGTEIVVVRELVGGIYFGQRQETDEKTGLAWDRCDYTVDEVKRIARVAAHLALTANPPHAVTSVDKANVLATSRLWRKTVTEVFANEFPQLSLSHQLVDSAAMIISSRPSKLNGILLSMPFRLWVDGPAVRS
jgi:3-isopropylmalate dehydrogenase